MPDDRQRIIQRLQSALRNEHLSVGCYDVHAKTATELRYLDMAATLRRMGDAHRRHIIRLERRIRELGGEPTIYHLAEIMQQNHGCVTEKDILLALEQDLKAEDTQVEEYHVLAQQSDAATADMCAQYIEEDQAHLRWLRDQVLRLNHWDPDEEELDEGRSLKDSP